MPIDEDYGKLFLQGCKRRDAGTNGFTDIWRTRRDQTTHLQSIMHRRIKRKKKKSRKKRSSATKLRFHLSRRDYCFYYIFFVDYLHHDSMARGGYSAFLFFSSFYSSYRRWCWSFLLGLLYMFLLSALVIWYRFIIPCIGSFFIFFFGNVPVLLRVYNPVSPYRSTRPQESRTTWSFMSMWRGWMG